MRSRLSPLAVLGAPLLAALLSVSSFAQSWSNLGGNSARNGLVSDCGPTDGRRVWARTELPSLIAWYPVISNGAAFTVRQTGFPEVGGAPGDAIVAYDLVDGSERWRRTLPYDGDPKSQWTSWIGAVQDGRLLTSRSTQGMPQPLSALSTADGRLLWTSKVSSEAWAHDGVVLTPSGDWIIGDASQVLRLRGVDGSLIWSMPRTCSISGSCGVALSASGIYLDEPYPGGNRIVKLDPQTGQRQYSSPVMAGSTSQNSPFLAPSGNVVYFAQTEDKPAIDRLYAFLDDGNQLLPLWSRPVLWTIHHGQGVAADGTIYAFLPTGEFARLDPANGAVLNTAGVLFPVNLSGFSPKTTIDLHGRVYVSNGWIGQPENNGRLWAFSADLSRTHFILASRKPNAGGPAIGGGGYLVLADTTGVRAYRTEMPASEITRLGLPPNPNAFRPGLTTRPILGADWDPWIDHQAFAPDSFLDFVAFTLTDELLNVPLAGGTLLCPPPPAEQFYFQSPDTPSFSIPLPLDCIYLGVNACAQAGAVTPRGTFLTNALDLILGDI